MKMQAPTDLVSVDSIDGIELQNEPRAHRLIDALRDAQAQQLSPAVNE